MNKLLEDPWFAAQIETAIAPYRRRWTPSQVAAFRKAIAFTCTTHPNARAALLHDRPEIAPLLAEEDARRATMDAIAPAGAEEGS